MIRRLIAALLIGEAFLTFSWLSRIGSMVVIYDAQVLVFVGLRTGVAALQVTSALMLYRRAPPAARFAQWSLGLSAVLLLFEVGLRFSPSSIQPGLRAPFLAAYAVYAVVGIWALRARKP